MPTHRFIKPSISCRRGETRARRTVSGNERPESTELIVSTSITRSIQSWSRPSIKGRLTYHRTRVQHWWPAYGATSRETRSVPTAIAPRAKIRGWTMVLSNEIYSRDATDPYRNPDEAKWYRIVAAWGKKGTKRSISPLQTRRNGPAGCNAKRRAPQAFGDATVPPEHAGASSRPGPCDGRRCRTQQTRLQVLLVDNANAKDIAAII